MPATFYICVSFQRLMPGLVGLVLDRLGRPYRHTVVVDFLNRFFLRPIDETLEPYPFGRHTFPRLRLDRCRQQGLRL